MAGRQIKATLDGITYRRKNGKTERLVTFATSDDFVPDELENIELSVDIKPYKQKRSKDANAFMWELCGKLAEATRLDAVDIYRNEIQQHGIYKVMSFEREQDGKTMATAWEHLGKGWQAEKLDYTQDGNGVTYRFWYGSSVYNTAQMSRLIDSLAEDCRALGIDCSTEQERTLLLQDWKGAKFNA